MGGPLERVNIRAAVGSLGVLSSISVFFCFDSNGTTKSIFVIV